MRSMFFNNVDMVDKVDMQIACHGGDHVPVSILILCDIFKHVLQFISELTRSWLGASQERMGEQKENVFHIGYPKEEVNIIKGGKEHQA